MTTLQTDYGAVTAKAAQADAATGGAAAARSVAETALEDAAFVLARARANHFKKTGDPDRLGKVAVSKSEIMKLRTQELVNKTTATPASVPAQDSRNFLWGEHPLGKHPTPSRETHGTSKRFFLTGRGDFTYCRTLRNETLFRKQKKP